MIETRYWLAGIALLVIAVWFGYRLLLARRSEGKPEDLGVQAELSPALMSRVHQLLDRIAKPTVTSGSDIIPVAIVDGDSDKSAIMNFADAEHLGSSEVAAFDARRSVDIGLRTLRGRDDEFAVFAFSGTVTLEGKRTDAIIVMAYQRGAPNTNRFVQPYRIDEPGKQGAFVGPLIRGGDSPPRFAEP